jgi:methylated-DNA-[protein]-cysteine S-methyltransferase
MAIIESSHGLCRLTFGHDGPREAIESLEDEWQARVEDAKSSKLARRLQAYAAGKPDDFRDVTLDTPKQGPFAERVVRICRKIRRGETMSYGELAEAAGAPGAARAVGNCMSRNQTPIVVPCHRVLRAGGKIGGYSAGSGLEIKRRMLALEGIELGGLSMACASGSG